MKQHKHIVGLAILLALSSCQAQDIIETVVAPHTERDIEFVPGGGSFQSLDVYLPGDGDGPYPTLLMIHGGGFRARSKGIYRDLAEHLTTQGDAVVSTNYRYSSNASYPAQVEDVFCALAWIHSNSDTYGFDVENVYIWGGSAGGYLAAMIGTVDDPSLYLENCPNDLPAQDWISGTIVFYGFFDFTNIDDFPGSELPLLRAFWGAPHEEMSIEQLEEMSPQSWVDGGESPFLLLHGTEDRTIPSIMSERFTAALESAGIEVELVLVEGAKHAFELAPLDGPYMSQALNAVESFIAEAGG